MSPDQEHRLEKIFSAARDLPPQEREAFLERACMGDAELRREADSLLSAHELAGQFLQPTVVLSTPNVPVEKPGDRIGRYKLLEQIGEGGFGVVWMAEQEEPVRRRVALKIIKLGMDTGQVLARFEAERQALAMMDHPNIAIIFDGGATDTGRPYFVMELVKGVPITDYCDTNRLATRERLELFMQVCHAVQHAHQKGVIHRDLKPSNILVTELDCAPVPKVIDFGVAKATQARLTERTLFTGLHQMMGTPTYMSPEQAGLGALDIDTRSDIYALGTLLYELLTGRTPFTREEFEKGELDDIFRLIREKDPPKPSTRLGTLTHEELTTVSTRHQSEPTKLNRLVRGDLDWIVMKCLEKNRQRRYETPDALARDVARYLRNQPVLAVAPSTSYLLLKFVKRHRVGVALGAAIVALAASASTAALFAARAQRVEHWRMAERRQAAMEKAWLASWGGDFDSAEKSIQQAELAGASVSDAHNLRGALASHRGNYEEAIQHLEQAVRLAPQSVSAQSLLALAYSRVGQYEKTDRALRASAQYTPVTVEDHLFKALAESEWGEVTQSQAALETVMRQRPSVIARLIRAQVRLNAAMTTSDFHLAQDAVADASVAKAMLPDNPLALAISLTAHLILATAHEEAGRVAERAAALNDAAAEAAALRRFTNHLEAIWGQQLYFRFQGDKPAELEILRMGTASCRNAMLDSVYAVVLYTQGQFAEALTVLDRSAQGAGMAADFCRGYVLVELPGGQERAAKECEDLLRTQPALHGLYYQTVLRLLGRKQLAVQASLKLRKQPGGFSLRSDWYQRLLDYCCDRLSADELLQAAVAFRGTQGEAHFFIAMTQLADGNRPQAREHFRKAIGKHPLYNFHQLWSRAFLSRLDANPNWPQWIPAQPPSTGQTSGTTTKPQ